MKRALRFPLLSIRMSAHRDEAIRQKNIKRMIAGKYVNEPITAKSFTSPAPIILNLKRGSRMRRGIIMPDIQARNPGAPYKLQASIRDAKAPVAIRAFGILYVIMSKKNAAVHTASIRADDIVIRKICRKRMVHGKL